MLKLVLQNERRQFGRRQSRLSGIVHFPDGKRLACQVRNLSDAGALLSLTGATELPKSFVLTIDRTSVRVTCEVRHRNGADCGVQFRAEARGGGAPDETRPQQLAYGQLLALARAEQDAAEFDARYGQAIASASAANPRRNARA